MTKNKKIIIAVVAVVVAAALFVGGYFLAGVIFPKKTATDAVKETTEMSETTLPANDNTEVTEPSDDGTESGETAENDVSEYLYLLENEKIGSGEIKVSKTEYEYYCVSVYNSLLYNSYMYDAYYGEGAGLLYTGFDWQKLPAEQECTTDFEGKTFDTYEEYIEYAAKRQIITAKSCAEYAKLNSITLSEAELKEVDELIAENKATCEEQGFSFEEYLKKFYSNGMTEALYRQIVEELYIVNKVDDVKSGVLKEYYTDEKVEEEYNKNIKEYGRVTLRAYIIVADTDDAGAVYEASMNAAKGEADVFAGLITDEESFKKQASEREKRKGNESYTELLTEDSHTLIEDIDYEELDAETNDEAFADWAFDEGRKAGDIYTAKIDSVGYGVYMMVDPLHKPPTSYTYDVRHILLQFEETKEGAEPEVDNTKVVLLDPSDYAVTVDIDVDPTNTADPSLYMETQAILEKYLAGDCTEDSFAALAKEHSADGNASEGGIYSDVTEGYMVAPFENWALEENRQTGDVGIVETQFGYHIMYSVDKKAVSDWIDVVRDAMIYDGAYAFTQVLAENYTLSMESVNKDELEKLYQESINNYKSYFG